MSGAARSAAGVGPVVVACAEPAIADAVRAAGGEAVLTDPALPPAPTASSRRCSRSTRSGASSAWSTCRATCRRSTRRPLRHVLEPLDVLGTDMATLANADRRTSTSAPTRTWSRPWSPSTPDGPTLGRALYFTRATAPSGPGPVWHHIGIYAFTPRGAGALRRPAAEPARAARAAGAAAGAGERHDHRRAPRRRGPVRRRHARPTSSGRARILEQPA